MIQKQFLTCGIIVRCPEKYIFAVVRFSNMCFSVVLISRRLKIRFGTSKDPKAKSQVWGVHVCISASPHAVVWSTCNLS